MSQLKASALAGVGDVAKRAPGGGSKLPAASHRTRHITGHAGSAKPDGVASRRKFNQHWPMDNDSQAEGLKIVLTPVQMAAVMTGDNIPEEASFTNRLWGAVKTVGGVVELLGASALCLTPEPTGATKVGCVVLAVHGSDTSGAGLRQVISGRSTITLTEQQVRQGAQALGAGPEMAGAIALTVDVALPALVATMVGAARLASVRGGRFELWKHEAQSGSKIGGHTISKHVGKTEAELRTRLVAEPRIPAAGSFLNYDVAERALSYGLKYRASEIRAWAMKATLKSRPETFDFPFKAAGHGVLRTTDKYLAMNNVRMVLKYQEYKGMPYYVLTAFPIP